MAGITIVTKIITKLIRCEFCLVMFQAKTTKSIIGEFSSGSSLQDSVHVIRSVRHWIGKGQAVFSNGPENFINQFAWDVFR